MNKLCECGCGREVLFSHHRYINGHNRRGVKDTQESIQKRLDSKEINKQIIINNIPMPLCKCGCGGSVTKWNNEYLWGHSGSRIISPQATVAAALINKGSKRSDITRSNISKALKGKKRKPLSQERKLIISAQQKGKKISEEQKLASSKRMTGNKLSEETKKKISAGRKGKPGPWRNKKIPPTARKNMSISAIRRINRQLEDGQRATPSYGNNETYILDILEKETNTNSEEVLRNDEELFFLIGKWCDSFFVKHNLCVEVLEPHHFKSNGELIDYDIKRQALIAYELSCMIYYIPEQEFLKNPKKEIQRFKDFISLLNIAPN